MIDKIEVYTRKDKFEVYIKISDKLCYLINNDILDKYEFPELVDNILEDFNINKINLDLNSLPIRKLIYKNNYEDSYFYIEVKETKNSYVIIIYNMYQHEYIYTYYKMNISKEGSACSINKMM